MKFYKLGDRANYVDREKLGVEIQDFTYFYIYKGAQVDIQAVSTGEIRTPKMGEWYLSGSIVNAYRAPNDLSTEYHIARLVLTETITTIREVIVS